MLGTFVTIDNCFDNLSKKVALKIVGDFEDEFKFEVLAYGINVFLREVIKFILLSVVFKLLGYSKEFYFVLFNFIILRAFVGGTHRKTSVGCLVQSFITILSGIVIADLKIMPCELSIIISFILLLFVFFFAPIISDKRAKYSKNKRYKFKTVALLIISIQIVFYHYILPDMYRRLISACELLILVELVVSVTDTIYIKNNKKEGEI